MVEYRNTADKDPIHYGPVWGKPRTDADPSYAACDKADTFAILSNHIASVTCPDCKALVLTQGEPLER